MEDTRIIQLYFARAPEAITETQTKYGPYCARIASNILDDPRDAEECVNDAYGRAWDTIPPQRPDSFAAYLGRLVRNLSLDRYRRNHAQRRFSKMETLLGELGECASSGDPTGETIDAAATAKMIDDFLGDLPKPKRTAFVLRYWHGLSVREIAAAYGQSESKIASLLFRLRKDLKAHLEQRGVSV